MNGDEQLCGNCGERMQVSSGSGRVRDYRGQAGYLIPSDLAFWECQNCGAEWMSASQIDRLGDAFEAQRRARARRERIVFMSFDSSNTTIDHLGMHGDAGTIRSRVPGPSVRLHFGHAEDAVEHRPGVAAARAAESEQSPISAIQPLVAW